MQQLVLTVDNTPALLQRQDILLASRRVGISGTNALAP